MNPWSLLLKPNLKDVTDRLAANSPLTGRSFCLEERDFTEPTALDVDPDETFLPKELRPDAYSKHVNGRIHDKLRDQTVFKKSKAKKYG